MKRSCTETYWNYECYMGKNVLNKFTSSMRHVQQWNGNLKCIFFLLMERHCGGHRKVAMTSSFSWQTLHEICPYGSWWAHICYAGTNFTKLCYATNPQVPNMLQSSLDYKKNTNMKNYPSISKAKQKLRWKPIVELNKGIKKTIKFYTWKKNLW